MLPLFYPEDGGRTFFRNVFRYQMHGIASEKIVIFIITAVRTLNLTSRLNFLADHSLINTAVKY
jgi:hypothetical protein